MMDQYRVMVSGCGGIAKRWVGNTVKREDAVIVGMVDILPENANKMKENFGLNCKVYENLVEAIADAKPDIVYDITPPPVHFQNVTAILRNGCACFGEKPMSDSLESAYKMVSTSDETGKPYFVMQNRRYYKTIRSFKELLSENVIGKLGILNSDFYIGIHSGGFREFMESPLILDMAIHTFDQARFLVGANPVSVYCHEFNPAGSWYAGNASATCIFEFDNGVVYTYRGSWCGDGCATPWDANWRGIGSKGSAIWENDSVLHAEVVEDFSDQNYIRKVKRIYPSTQYNGQEGHDGCIDAMFEALKCNEKAETDCHDNIKSLEMVFKAMESARLCKKLTW